MDIRKKVVVDFALTWIVLLRVIKFHVVFSDMTFKLEQKILIQSPCNSFKKTNNDLYTYPQSLCKCMSQTDSLGEKYM